jgi:hypothetical protein
MKNKLVIKSVKLGQKKLEPFAFIGHYFLDLKRFLIEVEMPFAL